MLDGSELSTNGMIKLLISEVVVCDSFLVGMNGSFPAIVPSSTESVGSGFLVLSLKVVVSSSESSFDESSVFLDKDGSSGHSFFERTMRFEETFICESGRVGACLGKAVPKPPMTYTNSQIHPGLCQDLTTFGVLHITGLLTRVDFQSLGGNGEGCDDGDLGEHVGRVILIKLIITQY
jgi:hypothetical protein